MAPVFEKSSWIAVLGLVTALLCLNGCGGGSNSVSQPQLQVTTTSLPGGTLGVRYQDTSLTAAGGVMPYSWSISSGALPAGLALASSTGNIYGTPTGSATGTISFTVQVTDTETPAKTATAPLSITIGGAALIVVTQSLPSATLGTTYSQTLAAAGGAQPYSWSISSGALPAGLSLNGSTGAISGTPSGPTGTYDFTAVVTDSENPPQDASAPLSVGVTTASSGPIQHVVVIVQENRTPDNLFQDPVLIANGADIQNYGYDSNGNKIQLAQASIQVDYDPDHSHKAFVSMCDLQSSGQCKMDGANLVKVDCNPGATDCPAPDLNFTYVDPSDVQPYFQMAEQYTFADQMFQTNQGPSMPAHQFLLAGTSAPTATSDLFASENPNASGPPDSGCDAVSNALVALIDPTGNEKSNPPIYPCFEHPTLTDLLEANGMDWKYYSPVYTDPEGYNHGSPGIWNAPEAIEHICEPNQPPPNGAYCAGTDWLNHVVLNQQQVLDDISSGQLATVTWVIPTGQASDHPGNIPGNEGPSWVASIVNAIGTSSFWPNTAIFVVWDDWGGFYDHVPPEQVLVNCSQFGCGYIYGFRVPLIAVSAYPTNGGAGYISHQQHDFGSILKYIEKNFGLPSLNYADAVADDFSDCFNYNQTPITFRTIQSDLKAEYFLNDKRPPLPPDND